MDLAASPVVHPSPESLARSFADAVAARWRGDDGGEGAGFERWLEAHWTPAPEPEPAAPPEAVSLLGGMPAVRWYALEDAVVGFAHGRRGCWWIPVAPSSAAT